MVCTTTKVPAEQPWTYLKENIFSFCLKFKWLFKITVKSQRASQTALCIENYIKKKTKHLLKNIYFHVF